jgi:hypothetical protein
MSEKLQTKLSDGKTFEQLQAHLKDLFQGKMSKFGKEVMEGPEVNEKDNSESIQSAELKYGANNILAFRKSKTIPELQAQFQKTFDNSLE